MSEKPYRTPSPPAPLPKGEGSVLPESSRPRGEKNVLSESPLPRGEGLGEGNKLRPNSTSPKLTGFARDLRKHQTDAEKKLWNLLRSRQIGDAKFRRQHPIGQYIADFYCHKHQLVIELDGSQHFTPEGKAHDSERTAHLEERGIRVLRFDNRQVLTETEAVLEEIHRAVTS
jgi:very-short-patch-repair endonuclease